MTFLVVKIVLVHSNNISLFNIRITEFYLLVVVTLRTLFSADVNTTFERNQHQIFAFFSLE